VSLIISLLILLVALVVAEMVWFAMAMFFATLR